MIKRIEHAFRLGQFDKTALIFHGKANEAGFLDRLVSGFLAAKRRYGIPRGRRYNCGICRNRPGGRLRAARAGGKGSGTLRWPWHGFCLRRGNVIIALAMPILHQFIAIQQWADLYGAELLRFLARRLACRHTAEDLLQETYLRCLEKPPEALENPRAYLYRVAGNLAVDHFRRHNRRSEHEALDLDEEGLEIADAGQDVETMVFSRQQVEQLKQAVEELSPRCREVFILHKFEHLSYAEVAAKLGISESTVVKHMVAALAHCRRRVLGDGVTPG